MRMTTGRGRLLGGGLVAALLIAAGLWWVREHAAQGEFRREWLEAVEDLSESLANDLLALSVAVRDRDVAASRTYLADAVLCAPLPVRPGALEPEVKWVHRHGWSPAAEGAERPVPRDEFLQQLGVLLDHFADIEDARFKVKEAQFEVSRPDEGAATVGVFIIGRDREGRREWLRATFRAGIRRKDKGPWQIDRLVLESMDSRVAVVDLFSEVVLPAGLSVVLPRYGTEGNEGFVYHGAAAGDVNLDGLIDLAVTGQRRNRLYLNAGTGRFRDVSDESLVGFPPPGTGALFLDYDNDGDPDLFLAAVGNQMLLENRWIPDGKVRFLDVSEETGVSLPAIGFSAAAADINGDRVPDIYVASYNRYGMVMPDVWGRATNGTPNLFFVSQGGGTYRDEAKARGVDDGRWSYAAAFADIDGDHDQDLFVANDFGEDALFRNEGGRFTDIASGAGVRDPGFGMGASFADYDNDGDLDLHVTNMSSMAGNRILRRIYPDRRRDRGALYRQASGNSLYENQGDGTFRDVSADAGGFAGGWAWGGGFFDFDNDGWEDLYTPNGFISGKWMKDT